MNPLAVLLAAFGALIGLSLSALWLLQADRRRARLAARIAGVAAARTETAPRPRLVATQADAVPAWQRAAALFGYSPEAACPVRWWLVPGFALVAARAAVGLVDGLLGPAAWLLLLPVWVFASRAAFAFFARRRGDALFRQFPDALASIVRAVRVGIPVSEAMRGVARDAPDPTAAEFGRLSSEVAIGVPLERALRDMAARNRLPEYRFFATALALQSQTGGSLSETLETLAEVIRKRVALRARGHALASEARTSAYVLAALPVLAALALWFLNRAYLLVLFDTPGGRKVLGAAIASLCCGMFVMRSIISRSLS